MASAWFWCILVAFWSVRFDSGGGLTSLIWSLRLLWWVLVDSGGFCWLLVACGGSWWVLADSGGGLTGLTLSDVV
jgi:hypothetical protein